MARIKRTRPSAGEIRRRTGVDVRRLQREHGLSWHDARRVGLHTYAIDLLDQTEALARVRPTP